MCDKEEDIEASKPAFLKCGKCGTTLFRLHLLLQLVMVPVLCDGSRHVPYRVRVRLARKRNEDEDSPNKLYTLVTHVPVTTFKGKLSSSLSYVKFF